MKTLDSGLQAKLDDDVTQMVLCLKMTRVDGLVIGFTDHNELLTIDSVTYSPAQGYDPSEITETSDDKISELKIRGALDTTVRQSDMIAGVYDHAEVLLFLQDVHDLTTTGKIIVRRGWIGEIASDDNEFTAELRGIKQAIDQRLGRVITPTCHWDLGDSNCGVDIALGSVSLVTSSAASNNFVFATDLTGIFYVGRVFVVTGTSGNNGTYTVLTTSYSAPNTTVTVTSVTGGEEGAVGLITPAGTFTHTGTVSADVAPTTKSFTATVQSDPVSSRNEVGAWYDLGLVEWTAGANFLSAPDPDYGLARQVRSHTWGTYHTINLIYPMPYTVAVGDTFKITAGCKKRAAEDCIAKFDRYIRFGGFRYIPTSNVFNQVARGDT